MVREGIQLCMSILLVTICSTDRCNDRWECTHLCMFQQVMLACRDWSVGWGGGYPLLRRSRDVICFWQSFYVNNLNSVLKLVLYFKILRIFSELNHMDITRYQAS